MSNGCICIFIPYLLCGSICSSLVWVYMFIELIQTSHRLVEHCRQPPHLPQCGRHHEQPILCCSRRSNPLAADATMPRPSHTQLRLTLAHLSPWRPVPSLSVPVGSEPWCNEPRCWPPARRCPNAMWQQGPGVKLPDAW